MAYACFIDEYGDASVFSRRELALAPPGAGALRVRHTAIGLNFIDIYQRRGLYPVALPAILGGEAAGVVEAVGDGVDGFAPGDRIAYLAAGGAYADAANIPAIMAAKIPDAIDDETAAAIFLKGLTAQMLLRQIYPLKAGETCLVYAAAGGVGSLLCPWAHHLGAHVIAVVGNVEKAAVAKSNGANDVIIRTKTTSISAEVRKLTGGRGVEVVYDSVGAATFEASLDSLALRGHMVSYGNASGPVPPFSPLELSRRGSLTLTRPSLFHYATPDRLPAMAAELFDLVARGVLQARIGHRFALDDVAAAHSLLESGASMGSIILVPGDS